MKKNRKIKRRINFQKIFCFASFIFILICILWYGGRLIYFYRDSKKMITQEADSFARIIKTQNHDQETFKQINQTYYFYGNATNNYVQYSNMLFRIIKVNKDNTVMLISEQVLATLAYGEMENSYQDSIILGWLNQNTSLDSGVLEGKLNEKETYLVKNSVCIDKIDDIDKVTCDKINNDYYLGLPSVVDYINTGGSSSFINNGRYSYLANQNGDNEIWYLNSEGKLDLSSGEDILGVKVTLTLSPTLTLKSGTGTSEDPYLIEDNTGMFGSYVKLDNDIWRVYDEEDGIVKLVFEDTLKENEKNDSNLEEEKFKYIYSKTNYYHNDTVYGSLAYYLNHTFLNQLSYRNLIIENTYVNGYYGSDMGYQYQDLNSHTIETKVSVPSIGDVILNDNLDGYFLNTGVSEKSSLVYVRKSNGMVTSKNVVAEAYVVPCISIQKENLTIGQGSLTDPYRTE